MINGKHDARETMLRRSLSRRSALKAGVLGGTGAALGATVFRGARPASARVIGAQVEATTLTIALNGAPSDLDPHSQYDQRSTLAVRGPYEGLIGLKDDKTNEYVGLLAERWEANPDKSVWTFHLRDGITFHDGSPCDAEAVRASYERLLTLGRGAVNVVSRFVPEPGRITAPDPRTVVFDCGRPQPLFETAVAATLGVQVVNTKVAKAHEVDGDQGNEWLQINAEGTGTGPYRIVEFEPAELMVLERYEGYWGGWEGPHFDRIVVRVVEEAETRRQLLERGEVDIAQALSFETLRALEQNPDLRVDRAPSTAVWYFVLTEGGALAKPEARQAMCYAFPYDEVINGVYDGVPKRAVGPVAETVQGFAPETFVYQTDLERARELFAAAGVAEGTELTLMTETGAPLTQSAAQLFQANLEQIGMRLTIEAVDTPTFTDTFYGDAPAEERPSVMPWSWWPDYSDAWNQLYPIVSCESWGANGGNGGYYCNERVEELLAQAKDAADPAAYQAALAEAQQILTRDDPAAIYYAQPPQENVLRRDIGGFVANPINLGTYDFYRLHRTE